MRVRLVLLLAGLPAAAPAADPPDKLAADARAVLKANCHRCHSGDGSSSGYAFDVTKHDTLVKPADGGDPVVVGKSLDKSALWDAVQKRMPQKGAPERDKFGDPERAVLKAWIEAGAPAFECSANRPFLPLTHVLAAVRDDLQKAPKDDRPYLRYFVLTHVHNNPCAFDEDLRYLRAALSKVVNSLSWKARVAVPRAADKEQTVYAVDVRDLDWDRDRLWERVTAADPYSLGFPNHPELKELDDDIRRLARTQLAWVRADWFVATASRPPLYHDLLQLPTDARVLEARLKVDVADDFRRDRAARAGFAKSGVSEQNRLVQRHDAAHGAYWKSYDFLPGAGRGRLARFPLGPELAGNHPFPELAFRHDGGEIIFSLPNGLQGYMLVDSKDRRIDAGPVPIVSDDKRVSGTPEIVNGISCMACHQHGMIPARDFVRDAAGVFGEAAEKVRRLYPEPAAFDRLVAGDRDRFLAALRPAVAPFLQVDEDKATELTKFKEPVSEVVIGYRRGYLDLKAAAAELFVEKPDDLLRAVGDRRLKELGLEALLKPGGLVGRRDWEAGDGVSLMQEVARGLRYTPIH